MRTNLRRFQSGSMVHSLCRGVVVDPVRLCGAEELLCFDHVLQTGMEELERCPVHRPEHKHTNTLQALSEYEHKDKTCAVLNPHTHSTWNEINYLSRYTSSALKGYSKLWAFFWGSAVAFWRQANLWTLCQETKHSRVPGWSHRDGRGQNIFLCRSQTNLQPGTGQWHDHTLVKEAQPYRTHSSVLSEWRVSNHT